MKTLILISLFAVLAACASQTKQQVLMDAYQHKQQLDKLEKEIDLGLPKTEKDFFEQIRKEIKSKDTLKI